jgi:hypothetical protein
VALCSVESVFSVPEITRNIVIRPANGSAIVFHTNAEAAPLSVAGRGSASSDPLAMAVNGRSAGDGA